MGREEGPYLDQWSRATATGTPCPFEKEKRALKSLTELNLKRDKSNYLV